MAARDLHDVDLAVRARLLRSTLTATTRRHLPEGITPSMGSALGVLRDTGGCSPSRLAKLTGVTGPSASSMIKSLLDRGLVEVRRSTADRRSSLILLMPAGRAAADAMEAAEVRTEAAVRDAVGDGDLDVLRTVMAQMLTNLGRVDAAGSEGLGEEFASVAD